MRHPNRFDLSAVAAVLFALATLLACSDDSSPGPSLTASDSGAADGGPQPDASGAFADASDSGATGADATADAGDTGSTDAASDATPSRDAAVDAGPSFDAGAGCIAPVGEAPLSATAAGVPGDGLVLWVRGDHGVFKTAQNEVCAWADQSGGTRVLTPASVRPVWQATSVGGQAAVHFNALGTDLDTDVLGLPATGARTFVAVTQLVNTDGRFHPILQGQSGSAGTYLGIDSNTYQTSGNLEGLYFTNNSYDTALATSTTPRLHVMTVSTLAAGGPVAAAVDYRVNGVSQTLTLKAGSGTVADFSAANFTAIGAVSGTSTTGALGDGMVAEAIVYNRALTPTERTTVEAALEARYGIH